MKIDGKAGGVVQKVEAGGFSLFGQIAGSVIAQPPNGGDSQRDCPGLIDEATLARVAPPPGKSRNQATFAGG
jgi:hypothetical protein